MKIVIDTNRIIAALIKDGISRRIIFNEKFQFVTPDHSITEINNHRSDIILKTAISDTELELLLSFIFEKIEIIPEEDYIDYLERHLNVRITLISTGPDRTQTVYRHPFLGQAVKIQD